MSVTLTLVPLAVAVGITLTTASAAILKEKNPLDEVSIPPLETPFQDADLLVKTLTRHGLQVQPGSPDEILVPSEAGLLRYYRKDSAHPFSLRMENITNLRQLLDSVEELTQEYHCNVQTFTYQKVMEGLQEHGLCFDSEEILEDGSILLTLNA